MAQPTTIRVIKNKIKLLGKERSFGEFIPEDEFNTINPAVQSSLISSRAVEVINGNLTNEEIHEMLNKLITRVEQLEEKLSGKNDVVLAEDTQKSSEQADRKPRKGDNVEFEEMDDSGNIFLSKGEVLRVRGDTAAVLIGGDVEQEVKLKDLTIV